MYTWTGTYLRVQVIRSTDGGKTWSKPVPVAPASDTHDQFFPSLSVSPTGKVGVSWLDRRNDPNNIDYQAFAAISTDGGRTFPNTQLTEAFSNPDTQRDRQQLDGRLHRQHLGGSRLHRRVDGQQQRRRHARGSRRHPPEVRDFIARETKSRFEEIANDMDHTNF